MTTDSSNEEFTVKGDDLLAKVKQIIREGNARRLIIKDKDDQTMIEIPLTAGVVGIVIAPVLAAVGAIAALVTECTILVERREEKNEPFRRYQAGVI